MLEEIKTAKCPRCGYDSVLTPWKPPIGLNPRLRQYRCSNVVCGTVFYMVGIKHTSQVKP